MVGTTRSRAYRIPVKEPTPPSDEGTVADTPSDQNANCGGQQNAYSTPQVSQLSSARDDIPRLSEGLKPMHLDDQRGE
jgi:hypothetical protein